MIAALRLDFGAIRSKKENMKLTLQLKPLPSPEQTPILLATMERSNAAASHAARVGFEAGVFSQPTIQGRCYKEIRERFGLSAQMAVRAIGKAVEAFARDKTKSPCSSRAGRSPMTKRILSFMGLDQGQREL
jgi:putative transposase